MNYNTWNGSKLTGLTCSKALGFWMIEHQLVSDEKNKSGNTPKQQNQLLGEMPYVLSQVKLNYAYHVI